MPASQLRIAILSVHSCPVGTLGAKDTGGMSVYIVELARELGKQGHSVDAYTRVHDPQDPQIVNLGQNARLIHLRAGEDEEIHKLAVYSHLPDFACNLEDFRKYNNLQYDLVFSHYWLSAWVGNIYNSGGMFPISPCSTRWVRLRMPLALEKMSLNSVLRQKETWLEIAIILSPQRRGKKRTSFSTTALRQRELVSSPAG